MTAPGLWIVTSDNEIGPADALAAQWVKPDTDEVIFYRLVTHKEMEELMR